MSSVKRALVVAVVAVALSLPALPAQAQEFCVLVMSKNLICVREPTP